MGLAARCKVSAIHMPTCSQSRLLPNPQTCIKLGNALPGGLTWEKAASVPATGSVSVMAKHKQQQGQLCTNSGCSRLGWPGCLSPCVPCAGAVL